MVPKTPVKNYGPENMMIETIQTTLLPDDSSNNKKTFQLEFIPPTPPLDPNFPITGFPRDFDKIICPFCKSNNCIKKGKIKHDYRDDTQRYQCKNSDCGKKFIIDPARHFHFPLQVIEDICHWYVHGNDADFIAEEIMKNSKKMGLNINITSQTALNIIRKVSALLGNFEYYLYHDVKSRIWEIDDCYQKISKKKYYQDKIFLNKIERNVKMKFVYGFITNVLVINTRYWLAAPVTLDRKTGSSLKAISQAVVRSKYEPKVIRSDDWQPHIKAVNKVLPNTLIDSKAKTEKKSHINCIERMNRSMRSRAVKKGLTFPRIELLEAAVNLTRIEYNFLKPHATLDGKTPAQAAGITIPFTGFADLIKYADYLNLYKNSSYQ